MAGQGVKQQHSLKSWCPPPCSHSYVNAIYTGWAMFTGWKMGSSPRMYSTVSSPLGLGVEATPNYTSRTYASVT